MGHMGLSPMGLNTYSNKTDGGILLTQDKYALELLGRAGMKNIGEAVSL
jgi:hypothetical protein